MSTSSTQVPVATAWRAILWGFVALFATGSAIHVVLALTNPQSYDGFADMAFFNWTTDAWQNVFMAHPTLWALALAAGELTVAVLLVQHRRLGYVAVVLFHLALMLFGWGLWLWCVPALAFALPATRHAFHSRRRN
jgi:hypothetical protein